MNYTQQYDEQFDRIWGLIEPDPNYLASFTLPTRDRHGRDDWVDYTFYSKEFCIFDLIIKCAILCHIFTAKDEKGEWVLGEGNMSITKYIKKYDYDLNKLRKFVDKYIKKENADEQIHISNNFYKICGELEYCKKTVFSFRDLFRKNCIPANDPEQDKQQIENLKLIKW